MVNIDGKKIRGSATKAEQQLPHAKGGKSAKHIVHAWCGELGRCLGHYRVCGKSNEITAIPQLLDFLELEGCVVTIDALGCQKKPVSKVRQKKADYLISTKGNQEVLELGIFDAFDRESARAQRHELEVRAHGRSESRICEVLPAASLWDLVDLGEWEGLKYIVRVRSRREVLASGAVEEQVRYYISSVEAGAEAFNQLVREHWNIENQLHWVLDVVFGEDGSRKRAKSAAENFSTIRKVALNLLKEWPETISINRKRNKCAMSDKYREGVLKI